MRKQKTLFDHINQITKYKNKNYWKSLDEVDKKTWSTYMINRFISMDLDWCTIISYTQKYNLSPKIYYTLLLNMIPKSNKFLRYIKKSKKETYTAIELELLSKYFECSRTEINSYCEILSKNQIKEIIKLYGNNK